MRVLPRVLKALAVCLTVFKACCDRVERSQSKNTMKACDWACGGGGGGGGGGVSEAQAPKRYEAATTASSFLSISHPKIERVRDGGVPFRDGSRRGRQYENDQRSKRFRYLPTHLNLQVQQV